MMQTVQYRPLGSYYCTVYSYRREDSSKLKWSLAKWDYESRLTSASTCGPI